MRTERHGRMSATSPGKHGLKDWRVTFNGAAPTHAEVIAMLGFLLLAEERYDRPGQLGRYYLWNFVDALFTASKSPEAILHLAAECDADVAESRGAA